MMARVLIILLALCAVGVASPDEAHRLTKEGLAALKKGDFETALIRFRDAQVEEPDSERLHFNVGLALYRLERFDEARAAFENAASSMDRQLEKIARLHIGNCAIKSGRYDQALDALNRALEIDANYEAARSNREWVIRKIAELARKKKDQAEKAKADRRFIEKLKEIIDLQTQAHSALRQGMLAQRLDRRPSRVERLEELFNVQPAEGEELPLMDEENLSAFFGAIKKGQTEISALTRKLIAEGKVKVASPQGSGGKNTQGGPSAPADPEIQKIAKALPLIEGALPILDRAIEGANNERFSSVHGAQEDALNQLLRAMDELLDALSLLIQDQVQLLKDTVKLDARTKEGADERIVDPGEVRDRAVTLRSRQEGLREVAQGISGSVEGQLQQLKSGQAAGTQPGQDPKEQQKKFAEALKHLLNATGHMETASTELAKPELTLAQRAEQEAVKELVKARTALSPPQQQSGDQEQKDGEKKENPDESKDGDSKDDKDKNKDGQEDNKGEGQKGEPSEQPEGEDGKNSDKNKRQEKLSPEQAKKMLERARQRERDRRKNNREKAERARGTGSKKGKDW